MARLMNQPKDYFDDPASLSRVIAVILDNHPPTLGDCGWPEHSLTLYDAEWQLVKTALEKYAESLK